MIESKRDDYYGVDFTDITGATVQEVVDHCHEHGIQLSDARVEYGPCGSHRVVLEVANEAEGGRP